MHTDSELSYQICGISEKPRRSLYSGVHSELWKMLMSCWAEEGERPPAQQMIKFLDKRYPNLAT